VTAVRVAVLLVTLSVAVPATTASASPKASETLPRSCGALSVGIGWHVRATRNVRCSLARLLIRTFLDRHLGAGDHGISELATAVDASTAVLRPTRRDKTREGPRWRGPSCGLLLLTAA